MKNITVIGGGVLGSQIAFQIAYSGFDVTVWLRSHESVNRTKAKLLELKKKYTENINLMKSKEGKSYNTWCNGISSYDDFNYKECIKKVDNAYKNIKFEIDLGMAIRNSDLVIESLSEDFNIKKDIYSRMSYLLPKKTIIVTNSSTMLPSKLAKYTGRPDMFLAFHFANSIWKNNIVEIMKHDNTSDKSFNKMIEFAREINMIPLKIVKEKSGYLLNSMLIPLLFSGLDLLVNGISDVESIDKAWAIGTGSPKGPFQILDTVGLKTAHEIVLMYVKIPSFLAPYNFKKIEKLLKKYIDEGKYGVSSGEGFYKYNK